MNKQNFLTRMLLLLALIVGSVNAWAAETPIVTADFTAKTAKNSSYGNTWTYGDWSLSGCANNNGGWAYIRCGGKGGDKATSTKTSSTTITGTTKISSAIKEVKLLHNGTSNASITINSIVLEVSSKSDFSSIDNTITETPTISKSTAGTVSFTTGAPYAANSYYRVTINWEVKGTSNYGLDVTKVEFYEAEAVTEPSINADDINIASDATSGEITYTISNAVVGATVAASSEDAWISNISVNESTKKVSFTTTKNTAFVNRVGTITLSYKDGSTPLDEVDVIVTQAKAIVTLNYTLATEIVPGKHYIITSGTDGSIKAMGMQNSNNRAAVDVTASIGKISVSSDAGVYEFLIEGNIENGYYTIYDANDASKGYLYAASSSSNHLKTEGSVSKGYWTISFEDGSNAVLTCKKGGSHDLMRFNSTLFSCYESGQDDVYLFVRDEDDNVQHVNVNIAEACTDGSKYYGTFSSPFAFKVPSDVTVSEISVIDGELLVDDYASGAVVPANTGVMISSSTHGSKAFTLVANGGTSVLDSDNMLKASSVDMTGSFKFYRLTMHDGTTIGFYWGADGGAAFDIAANKAYLAVPTTLARVEGFNLFEEEGEATAIEGVKTIDTDAPVFNLNGQRVNGNAKGLLIKNGKKFMNR